MHDDSMVVLQVCTDSIAADVLIGFLKSESIPAAARNLAVFPGLEQGTQVLVPRAYFSRAQRLLEQQQLSESELTELAMGAARESSER